MTEKNMTRINKEQGRQRMLSNFKQKKTSSRASMIKYFTLIEIEKMLTILSNDKKLILASYSPEKNGQASELINVLRAQGQGQLARSLISALKKHDNVYLASVLDEIYKLNKETELLFVMGLALGARVSEILSLTWSQIDFERERVHVAGTKTKTANRICVMPPDVWEKLREYKEYISKKYDMRTITRIFPFSQKTANRRLKYLAKRIGIKEDVWWHRLRHTHIVQSKRKGQDWNVIAQQTGDIPATLMNEYSKIAIEDRQEIVKVTDWIPKIDNKDENNAI